MTTNWGRWGEEDERGAANLLTSKVVLEACSTPRAGRVYNLGIELRSDAPFAGRRISPVHLMSTDGGDYAALGREDWGTADDYLFLACAGTTHVDSLAHMWSGGSMYNGFSFREVRSSGAARCGIEKAGGLVTRALLLDFSDHDTDDRQIDSTHIDSWFTQHGVEPRPGDAVLFRTGWMDDALAGSVSDDPYPVVGLDAANWIAEHDVAVIAADNQAVETVGRRGVLPPLHGVVMRDLGVYILEMLTLAEPATAGVTQGLFVVAPLLITRGVNSPVNPLLIALSGSLARSVAIVGVGATSQGEHPGRSANALAIEALAIALRDAGISKDRLDGLVTCKAYGTGAGTDTQIGALAGLNPCYSATLEYGTCNFSLHLAAMAISSGMATTIALVYGTNQRTAGERFTSVADSAEAELLEPYGFLNFAGLAAMAARRRIHLYGLSEAQLGTVAVTQRRHARLNPLAIFNDPLSIEDYLAHPYLVAPLRRPDVCMISDGAVCIIVTAPDHAGDHPHPPVDLLGGMQRTGLNYLANEDQLMRPWAQPGVTALFESADLGPADIDLLMVQDATSVAVLEALEMYGFCKVGEAGEFVEDGGTSLGGPLPVNTSGGQLSESYMWGWLHLYEIVQQLRGHAGERQVRDASTALYASTQGYRKVAASIFGTR